MSAVVGYQAKYMYIEWLKGKYMQSNKEAGTIAVYFYHVHISVSFDVCPLLEVIVVLLRQAFMGIS